MPTTDAFVGATVAHYRVVSILGSGGMGTVYRARDTKLDRDVALKVLPDAFAGNRERMLRFDREAKVLASLNHPNIAAVYGLEDSGGKPVLVMELVDGPTLADRIRTGPLPVEEALRIARQMADALEYAHERGIIHRDLKPANIKVTADDAVKVLDFGLAKAVEGEAAFADSSTSPTITRMATEAGILLGTAAYMPPEQAKGKQVDRRADIWSFGCVLYEMLTGRMSFPGETTTDTLAAVIRGEPDWLRLPKETPLGARILLQRCLQKDPKQRLRDIGDARLSIDEMLSGALPSLAGAPITVAVPHPQPLWKRTLPWALFAAAAVIAVVLGALHLREGPSAAAFVRFEIPVPENLAVAIPGAFALSPDGRQFAFFATGADEEQRLWIRSLDSLDARPLPGSESLRAAPFFWSPDSRYIAFGAGGQLKKIPVSGGPAVVLCAVPGGTVLGGSWNRAGDIIFGSSDGIMLVSANGGSIKRLTAIDAARFESDNSFPEFLPDGRHFLYERRSSRTGLSGIYAGSIDAKPQDQNMRRIVETETGAVYIAAGPRSRGRLLFLRNRELMAQPFDLQKMELTGDPAAVAAPIGHFSDYGFFSASADGSALVYRSGNAAASQQLTWFNRQGKSLGVVGEPGEYGPPSLSPDGTQAAIGAGSFLSRTLWLMNFRRGTSARFTFGSAAATTPVWSPNGEQIVFSSSSSGVFDLYEKPASGAAGAELLLKSNEDKYASSISPDGRFLLYDTVNPNTKRDLWVLPLTGDKKPYPFLRTPANEWDGHFSPDGNWVAYVSDESGRFEVYVRRFSPGASAAASGGKWQISYGGGEKPEWSRNGKELYYLTSDSKVMAVPVSTNPVFQAGQPRLLFQAPNQLEMGNPGNYTVDGKRFLLLAREKQSGQTPFVLLLNWLVTLRR